MNVHYDAKWSNFAFMKNYLKKWTVILSVITLFSGCDLIDYHPYDSRYDGEKALNSKAISRIEQICAGRDSIRFAMISDTQRWYDETEKMVKSINARGDVDFVVHCGDMTDFGMTREFDWMERELRKFAMPHVCVIGNHDCLGTGGDVFRSMYGNPDFSFNAGDTHFMCLNTNAVEYDYSTDIPNFSFIKSDLAAVPDSIRRTVVAMHAAPLTDQFGANVAEVFHEKIKQFPGLQFCICGHNHSYARYEPLEDGLLYYRVACAKKLEYIVFTLQKDGGYTYEVVHC